MNKDPEIYIIATSEFFALVLIPHQRSVLVLFKPRTQYSLDGENRHGAFCVIPIVLNKGKNQIGLISCEN